MKNIICLIFLSLIVNSCTKEKLEIQPAEQPTISKIISSKGGSLVLKSAEGDSLILEIPDGALKDEVNISMKIIEGFSSESIENTVFPGIVLGPDNLILEQAVKLIIEFADPQEDINMVTIFNAGNPVKLLKTETISSSKVQADLLHFSPYSAGIPTYEEIMQLLMENIVYEGSGGEREILEIIDDAYSLSRHAELLDILDNSEEANEVRESAKGYLEEGIMTVLNDLPEDPDGSYITTFILLGKVAEHFLDLTDLVKELNYSICSMKNKYEGNTMPIVLTTFSKDFEGTTAIVGGEVTEDWCQEVTERGIYFNDKKIPLGDGLGSFETERQLLVQGTYKVKAYATNRFGTTYGEEKRFVVDIDGNIYPIVTIGEQEWITENLKTTRYNDGTSIVNIEDPSDWGQAMGTEVEFEGFYCWYENKISYRNDYGALYNWLAVEEGKLCPVGWHVPSAEEYLTLIEFVGGIDIGGGMLKETGTSHWKSPNTGATNEYGLTALPGGYRIGYHFPNYEVDFVSIGEDGVWWTSTLDPRNGGYYVGLSYDYQDAGMGNHWVGRGGSIRCVED